MKRTRCTRSESCSVRMSARVLIGHKNHSILYVYSVTVVAHVIALEANLARGHLSLLHRDLLITNYTTVCNVNAVHDVFYLFGDTHASKVQFSVLHVKQIFFEIVSSSPNISCIITKIYLILGTPPSNLALAKRPTYCVPV